MKRESSVALRHAVKDLYHWQHGKRKGAPSFTDLLFILIQKADSANLARLRLGFPDHVDAFFLWYESKDPQAFFETFGLGIKHEDSL